MVSSNPVPDTRDRLLIEARRTFAAKGFDKASTREICKAARTQVGLIAYYFGDKAGLYRAVLADPLVAMIEGLPLPDDATPLEDWLRRYYQALLEPLQSHDAAAREVMQIFGRELSEPTEVFEHAYAEYVIPQHRAIASMLARRVGAAEIDAQVNQLTLAVVALANDYWVSDSHIEALAPGLLKDRAALIRVLDRLVAYGMALIQCETRLRRNTAE